MGSRLKHLYIFKMSIESHTTMKLHIRITTLKPRQTPTPHQLSKATQTEIFLSLLKTSEVVPSPNHSPSPTKYARTEVYHHIHRQEHRSKGRLLHQRTPRHQNPVQKDQERQEMRQTSSCRHLKRQGAKRHSYWRQHCSRS